MGSQPVKVVINQLINDKLNLGECLDTVKYDLEHKFRKTLSELDSIYIEEQYVDLLLTKWLEQAPELAVRSVDPAEIVDFTKDLESARSYQDCSVLCVTSKFTYLILSLYQKSSSLKVLEEKCVLEFKQKCLIHLQLRIGNIQEYDLNFIKELVNVLKQSFDLPSTSALLKLREFYTGTITFKYFIQNLLEVDCTDSKFIKLKDAGVIFANRDEFSIGKNLRDIIGKFLEPLVINRFTADGRRVLEVAGSHIVMSKVSPVLEREKDFFQIDEIRFVKAAVLYADVSLNSAKWKGKNLVIFAETLIVSNENIMWNVSGTDGEEASVGGKGDESDRSGADGHNGEAGGNVLLVVDSLEGGNLVITSNGGDGTKGGDGIPGADGEDGYYIKSLDFKAKFPPMSSFVDSIKLCNLKITKKNIVDNLQSVQIFSYDDKIIKENLQASNLSFWPESDSELTNCYIKGRTKEGCEIIFSFYFGNFLSRCQSYLLLKGAPGQHGQPGSQGGRGGKAGLAGDIDVHIGSVTSFSKVKRVQNNGSPGADGNSGPDGKPGRTGGDYGYMDKTLAPTWPKRLETHPEDDSKLTVEYSSEESSTSDNVFCTFKKQYAVITKMKKASMRSSMYYRCKARIEQPSCQFEQVKRKKPIHLKNMVELYKINMLTSANKCYDSLEAVKGIVEELIACDLQTTNMTADCKITRQVSYCCNSGFNETSFFEECSLDDLDINPEIKIKCENEDNKDKLNVLRNIQRQHFITDSSATENTRSLKLLSNYYNQIFSIVQEDEFVEHFFCLDSPERRSEVAEWFVETDKNELTPAIKVFINTFGHAKAKKTATMYFKRHKCLKEITYDKTRNRLVPLLNILERPEGHNLLSQLCESIYREDHGKLFTLFYDIKQKDAFLQKLYALYQSEKRYNWAGVINHKNEKRIRKEMCEEIIEKGPLTKFYREFLSYRFDKNILVYIEDNVGNYVLESDHNPGSVNKTHILLKDNTLYNLSVKVQVVQLLHNLDERGCLYSRILFNIENMAEQSETGTISSWNPLEYADVDKKTTSYIKYLHMIKQDRDIKIIQNEFNSEDSLLITPRLEKLKHNYIGYSNILHYMALHLEHSGKCISAKEFCFVLNFILRSALTIPISLPTISWSIASSPPSNWLIEITLLKLEMGLERVLGNETRARWGEFLNQYEKAKLMAFFQKISEEKSRGCSLDTIDEVLHLMFSIPRAHVGLEHVDLADWKYYLKDRYWFHKLKSTFSWTEDEIKLASLYFVLLENSKGLKITNNLFDVVAKELSKRDVYGDNTSILEILRDLVHKDVCLDDIFLKTLSKSKIYFWKGEIEKACSGVCNERSLSEVVKLIQKCGNTSSIIKNNLESIVRSIDKAKMIEKDISVNELKEDQLKDKIDCLLKAVNTIYESLNDKTIDMLTNNNYQALINSLKMNFKSIVDKLSAYGKSTQRLENLKKSIVPEFVEELLFAVISTVINIKKKISLRKTQILSIMTILKIKRNILAQITTGEGKSLIIVCVAIIKAVSGQKVDVITSSNVLAERDAKEYADLYNLFGLSVGHNCSENMEERKKVYSTCHIVYGELANFQRDFLLDRMYNKNILGDRTFEIVLVDEVDSLLLDRGNNTLYLSHDIPGLDHLEPLFVYIWKRLNMSTGNDVVELKEDILITLGLINKNCLRELDCDLSETKISDVLKVLMDEHIISQNGIIVENHIDYDELYKKTENIIDVGHLQYMLNKVKNREKPFVVPNYLKEFVYRHLDSWIESAIMAMSMENGKHYVVDVDRSGTSPDRSPNITILDGDTGTDQTNCQWENCLHQFLQLKHGCKLFPISLKAVFISNVSYIKKYKTLYGLSGTLGTTVERSLLSSVYEVDYVTIPTAKVKQFIEMPSITCKNQEDWIQQIISSVYEISTIRSSLIICESVNDVKNLKTYFVKFLQKKNVTNDLKVHTYTRDYEQLVIAESLGRHQIIISTNLAGRGTDIKLSQELINAGGLHVCLSFLPRNSRVEEQAYGRVARNGQPGTAQLIFMSSHINSISKIVDLKKKRNLDEVHRITDIKKLYDTQIKSEEKHLELFQNKFLQLKKEMKHKENIKSLLLQICLDKWAYWLDEHVDNITSTSLDEQSPLIKEISKVLTWNYEDSSCIKDPIQLTKLGVSCLENELYETSMLLFNRVIKEEKDFSEVALYYRICAKVRLENFNSLKLPHLVDDFLLVEDMLNKRILSSLMSGRFIDWLKSHNANSIMQIDSFKEQQQQRSSIYNVFRESINDIKGHAVLPSCISLIFAPFNEIHGYAIFRIYNTLVEEGVISIPSMESLERNYFNFSLQYGIHPKEITACARQSTPCRELFWSELVKNNLLENETKFVFINNDKLAKTDGISQHTIKSLQSNKLQKMPGKKGVWLFKNNEIQVNKNWLVFKKCTLLTLIGHMSYKLLKKQGVAIYNKQATTSPVDVWETSKIKFAHFDSLSEEDFSKSGISNEVTRSVIRELLEVSIIEKGCLDTSSYILKSDEENIEKLELTEYPEYTKKIKSLLTYHFSFRIAYKKLISRLKNKNGKIDLHFFVQQTFLKNKEVVLRNIFLKNNHLMSNNNIIGRQFIKKLKSFLPSRELFWNELLANNLILHEVKYILVDFNKLEQEMPSFSVIINSLTTDNPSNNTNAIWLYKTDELTSADDNSTWFVFQKPKLLSVIGEKTYKYLKKQGIIVCNKQAIISPRHCWKNSIKFTYFDSLTEEDFNRHGISNLITKKIIMYLVEQNVIRKCDDSTSNFILMSDEEKINKIQLAQHSAYTSDVQSLLTHHFAFRIAYQKLLKQKTVETEEFVHDGEKLCLPLQPKLYQSFFAQFQEVPFSQPKVNHEGINSIDKLHPKSICKQKWVEYFTTFFNTSNAEDIVSSLIEHNVISKSWFSTKYYINYESIKDDDNESNMRYNINMPKNLPENLKIYKGTIKFILIDYIKLSLRKENLKDGLSKYVGSIYSKDTPDFDFKPLLTILKQYDKPTSESDTFILNGFDKLIIDKEKAYTSIMVLKTSMVFTLAVVEIVAGAALMTYFSPLGSGLISEGVGDLVYVFGSLWSGYISTSEYIKTKVLSFFLTFLVTGYRLYGLYRSTFGLKSSGLTIKGVMNNIKELCVKRAENNDFANIFVKRIVKATGLAVGLGVTNTLLQQTIKPQLEKLEEGLINLVYSNIEQAILEHEVIEDVKKTYSKFGTTKAGEISKHCFQQAIEQSQCEFNKSLKMLTDTCRTLMNGSLYQLMNSIKDGNYDLEFLLKLAEVVNNFLKLISSYTDCWNSIKNVVSITLNIFQIKLNCIYNNDQVQCAQNIDEKMHDYLISCCVDDWKKNIIKLISNIINEVVVSPLLRYTSNRLETQFIECGKFSFFSDEEAEGLLKSKPTYHRDKKNCEAEKVNENSFVDSEYNKLLFSLLKKNTHGSIFAEISKRKLTVDNNCIQICCDILPNLLKQEGIEVPPFEVVIETDGVQQRYKTATDSSDITTVYLSTNEGVLYNLSENRNLCISTLFDTIAKTILPPQTVPYVNELVRIVLSKIETNKRLSNLRDTQGLIFNKQSASYVEPFNSVTENKIHTQRSNRILQSSLLINLRGKQLLQPGTALDHILMGFHCALEQINRYISTSLLIFEGNLNLELQDFSESDYQLWPQFSSSGLPFLCQPACYELVLPLPVDCEDTLWEFLVTMRFISSEDKRVDWSLPQDPYILYEVCPLDTSLRLDKAIRGHILLSADCKRATHTIDQCHSAGELIMPTGVMNNCEVLIICDKEFENHIGDYIYTHGEFRSASIIYEKGELGDIKNEITKAFKSYKGITCAVLFIGSVCLSGKVDIISNGIQEIVSYLQQCLRNENVILCTHRLQKSTTLGNKQKRINNHLLSFCQSIRVPYVDLKKYNIIASSEDIKTAGDLIIQEIDKMIIDTTDLILSKNWELV